MEVAWVGGVGLRSRRRRDYRHFCPRSIVLTAIYRLFCVRWFFVSIIWAPFMAKQIFVTTKRRQPWEIPQPSTGAIILRARRNLRQSREQLSAHCGVGGSTLQRLELGGYVGRPGQHLSRIYDYLVARQAFVSPADAAELQAITEAARAAEPRRLVGRPSEPPALQGYAGVGAGVRTADQRAFVRAAVSIDNVLGSLLSPLPAELVPASGVAGGPSNLLGLVDLAVREFGTRGLARIVLAAFRDLNQSSVLLAAEGSASPAASCPD